MLLAGFLGQATWPNYLLQSVSGAKSFGVLHVYIHSVCVSVIACACVLHCVHCGHNACCVHFGLCSCVCSAAD